MIVAATLMAVSTLGVPAQAAGVLACEVHPPGEGTRIERCAERMADGTFRLRPEALERIVFGDARPAVVWIDDRLHFVARHGRTAQAFFVDNGADDFSEGLARTVKNGAIGFVDSSLEIVVPAQWDFAEPFSGGFAKVCRGCTIRLEDEHLTVSGGRWGYIDRTGRMVVNAAYDRHQVPAPRAPKPSPCQSSTDRVAYGVTGTVRAGEAFEQPVGRFILRLIPQAETWEIGVFEPGRDEDLSRYTLPMRGPNPRHLAAWYFSNADGTGWNDGTVNAPGAHRDFIFSPEVGRTIRLEHDEPVESGIPKVAKVEAFGRGTLDVLELRMRFERGRRPVIEWLRFAACLTWPREVE